MWITRSFVWKTICEDCVSTNSKRLLLNQLKKEIMEFLTPFYMGKSKIEERKKPDETEVTNIDTGLSDLIGRVFRNNKDYKHFNYFSEEDHTQLEFPAVIVDPIDGTKGLVRGLNECCISIAVMHDSDISNQDNFGILFNPFTGLVVTSFDEFILPPNVMKGRISGQISRSEFDSGLFPQTEHDNVSLIPKGSIALKLAYLATGACDFVFCKRDKMIWDIAAGAIICSRLGIDFYCGDEKILNLDNELFKGPFCWINPSHKDKISFLK